MSDKTKREREVKKKKKKDNMVSRAKIETYEAWTGLSLTELVTLG
jgi:hypothetical protein